MAEERNQAEGEVPIGPIAQAQHTHFTISVDRSGTYLPSLAGELTSANLQRLQGAIQHYMSTGFAELMRQVMRQEIAAEIESRKQERDLTEHQS